MFGVRNEKCEPQTHLRATPTPENLHPTPIRLLANPRFVGWVGLVWVGGSVVRSFFQLSVALGQKNHQSENPKITISKYGHDYMQIDRIDELSTMVVFIFLNMIFLKKTFFKWKKKVGLKHFKLQKICL